MARRVVPVPPGPTERGPCAKRVQHGCIERARKEELIQALGALALGSEIVIPDVPPCAGAVPEWGRGISPLADVPGQDRERWDPYPTRHSRAEMSVKSESEQEGGRKL